MKTGLVCFGRVGVILALLLTLALSEHLPTSAQAQTGAAAPVVSDPAAAMIFIENAGQFPNDARFQVRGRDLTLWLAEDAIWLTVLDQSAAQSPSSPQGPGETVESGGTSAPSPGEGVNIKLTFSEANPHPRLEPFNRLETHVSFFTGSDPAKWRADVPAWGGVRYVELYPGIDLELTGEQGRLLPRLVARPGADLSVVRLRLEGADTVAVEGDALRLGTAAGDAAWPLLRAEGAPAGAVVRPRGEMVFEVTSPFAPEEASSPGATAPDDNPGDLLYGTFLGGYDYDEGYGIVVDGSGAAYATGETWSYDFPTTPGVFDTTFNGGGFIGNDAFVVRLNAAGSTLDYATFLGGSGSDIAYGIAVDGSGAAYVTGSTESPDFPTTLGAFDTTHNGADDAFVVKLNAAGSTLDYATFLGESSGDRGCGIVVGGSGTAYVTGETGSSGFPTTPGAFDTSFNGGGVIGNDAFVVKLNAAGSALDYATFLGGSGDDSSSVIAIDGSGSAYVTGVTGSADLPTTPGAFDTTHNGGFTDAFVAKLNAAGSALDYATFLGGSSDEWGHGIAVDGSGAAYITGYTDSSDFPTTPGAFDTSHNDGSDAFVVKMNGTGSAMDYATFLGGSGAEVGFGIALDGSGATCVTGLTYSSNFPTTPGAFDTSCGTDGSCNNSYDAFVVKLNVAGSAMEYAAFLGGSIGDSGRGITMDENGVVYVIGGTGSSDFPTTPGAFDTAFSDEYTDAFVVKLKVSFRVYLPLVIRSTQPSPDLLYGTFLGGGDQDSGYDIAVDGSGAAYIVGTTGSPDFPTTPGAFDTSLGDSDAFVVKLNPTGAALEYATFLGGSDGEYGWAIAVDEGGAAYVTGLTFSSDLPTTPGAFDTTCGTDGNCNADSDAFVVKLNAAGSSLVYATFLGGSSRDCGYDIAVQGNAAYVTGDTGSSDLPTTPGAFDTSYNGGGEYGEDAFVAKLNAAGSALVYGTFLGGSGVERGYGIAVDGSGAAHVTGETQSTDFPTTPGAFDTSYNGGFADAFVVKLNAAGSALDYGTFLGGDDDWGDEGRGIAVDGSGAVYVTGGTDSSDFPTTPGAFDTSYNGGAYGDAFVAKLNAAGSALVYATFLGGSESDAGHGIAVQGDAAYVTGKADSSDFPTTPGAFDTSFNGDLNGDAFVIQMNAAGSAPDYATFLGGSGGEYGRAIVVDGSGAVYITGRTLSFDMPITPGAFDRSYNGGDDAFVVKLKWTAQR